MIRFNKLSTVGGPKYTCFSCKVQDEAIYFHDTFIAPIPEPLTTTYLYISNLKRSENDLDNG